MANVCKAIEDIKKDAFEEGYEEECRNIAVRMIKAGKVSLEDKFGKYGVRTKSAYGRKIGIRQ